MVTYLKLFGTAFFWGGTFVAGRLLAHDVDPSSAAFFRFVIASFCLLIITWRVEGRFPVLNRRQLAVIAALGLTGVFSYNLCFFKGLSLIGAGRAALIIALNPVFITLFSAILHRERLPFSRIVGILLSVSGAIWSSRRVIRAGPSPGDRVWGSF